MRLDWKWKKVVWPATFSAPLNRRGHTAVFDEETKCIIVYGGVFGYSKILGDCHQIAIDSVLWG